MGRDEAPADPTTGVRSKEWPHSTRNLAPRPASLVFATRFLRDRVTLVGRDRNHANSVA